MRTIRLREKCINLDLVTHTVLETEYPGAVPVLTLNFAGGGDVCSLVGEDIEAFLAAFCADRATGRAEVKAGSAWGEARERN